jgi:hypothetical protein
MITAASASTIFVMSRAKTLLIDPLRRISQSMLPDRWRIEF